MSTIPSAFKTLGQKEKEVVETYEHSKEFRKLLKLVLEKKLQDMFVTSIEDYDKASWPYYQAHKNGKISAYRELLSIL